MAKKKTATITLIAFLGIILITFLIFGINYSRTHVNTYVYIEGKVTEYDVTPANSDGLIEFSIDNRSIDIGGGLRPNAVYGKVDRTLKVGDKVRAKLLHTIDSPYPSVYGCSECYVEKID